MGANLILPAGSAADDSDPVTRSLRFNGPDNPRLIRSASDIGTPTDAQKITISMWFKIGDFANDTTGRKVLLNANSEYGNDYFWIELNADNKLNVTVNDGGGTTQGQYITNRVFRDPTAWMHLCVAVDSTLADEYEADRCKIFINGVRETSFSTTNHWPRYWDNEFNEGTYDQYISGWYAPSVGDGTVGDLHFDGLIADVYNIDGAAIEPVGNFIEDTGYNSYKPKAFNMSSYGGNSFHLKFEETGVGTGDSDTVGADSSGQDNHFDSSGIVASDVLLDTPTKNYAVLNPLVRNNGTLSEGNLKFVPTTSYPATAVSTLGMSGGDGKFLCEWYYDGGTNWPVGISDGGEEDYASYRGIGFWASGSIYEAASATQTGLTAASSGDIVGVAVDLSGSNRSVQFYINGSTVGSAETIPSSWDHVFFTAGNYVSGRTFYGNFGQEPTFQGNHSTSESEFAYPITGYDALTASAYADPTVKAHENFNTITYGGTASSRSLGGVGFQPNMTWIKQRSSPNRRHHIQDSVRTAGRSLFPDADTSEEVSSNYVTSFDSNGFSLGTSSEINGSSIDYVAWNWKENASAGFDIVTWAGDSGSSGSGYSEQSVSHSLGVAPEMIIAKARSDNALSSNYYLEDWAVYHKDLSSDYFLNLNLTSAQTQHDGSLFSSIGASSASFGNDGYTYQYLNYADYYTSAEDYVAYLFASVDGVCKVGSYTGNGAADGPTVYCGFRPAFVMVKRISNSGSWYLWDNKRGPHNVINNTLYPDLTAAESGTGGIIDFTATGFKLRSTAGDINTSGEKRIFLAMAESPLKYANAR